MRPEKISVPDCVTFFLSNPGEVSHKYQIKRGLSYKILRSAQAADITVMYLPELMFFSDIDIQAAFHCGINIYFFEIAGRGCGSFILTGSVHSPSCPQDI